MSARISQVRSHLDENGQKSADDVVIVSALRTALCKGFKGKFAQTQPEWLLSAVLKGLLAQTKLDPSLVGDIQVGNVLMPGCGVTTARMAALHAGFPETVPVCAVNRQCSSALATCGNIAAAIKAGYIDIGIGAGVESMSLYYGPQAMPTNLNETILNYKPSSEVLIPMGTTSENVAKEFNVTRKDQDIFAFRSHQLAANAQKNGLFDAEIVPVEVNGEMVRLDDGIRETTIEKLTKLRPVFAEDGSSTAGNSSQVTDGAAAVLLMRRSTAQKLNMKILARWLGIAQVGVPTRIMGIGPVLAIPAVLKQTGLTLNDITYFEINEAFASQCVYCVRELGIDINKVNVRGGAIAFGHPMGATGARMIATAMGIMKKGDKAVVSMCVGIGMGVAAVLEYEG